MDSIITTSTGKKLSVNRVARHLIDKQLLGRSYPVPPTKEVEAYGGFIENVPDFDSAVYQREITQYINNLALDQFDLIVIAVGLLDDPTQDELFLSLTSAGVIDPQTKTTKADYLQYVVLKDIQDLNLVMSKILYLSTVTQQGIDEAMASFRATWDDKPILDFAIPNTQVKYALIYRDKDAAKFALLTWKEFCSMTGPEQSFEVAHYQMSLRLQWMQQHYGRK